MSGGTVEIERKWLMDGFPALPHSAEIQMEQAYLSFGTAAGATVRIRKSLRGGDAEYHLTIKGRGVLSRTEVEVPLTAEQYAALLPLAEAPPVRKRLRLYPLPGGRQLECSLVDEGEPGAFYYAEVEFASVAEAEAFAPPAWLGREVTNEPGHTMAAYARRKAQAGGGPPGL